MGSSSARKALAKQLAADHPDVRWSGADLHEINEEKWESIVVSELKRRKKNESDVVTARKGVSWKVKIAQRLRRETTAPNPWIAKRLNMGHPNRVSIVLKNKC